MRQSLKQSRILKFFCFVFLIAMQPQCKTQVSMIQTSISPGFTARHPLLQVFEVQFGKGVACRHAKDFTKTRQNLKLQSLHLCGA